MSRYVCVWTAPFAVHSEEWKQREENLHRPVLPAGPTVLSISGRIINISINLRTRSCGRYGGVLPLIIPRGSSAAARQVPQVLDNGTPTSGGAVAGGVCRMVKTTKSGKCYVRSGKTM